MNLRLMIGVLMAAALCCPGSSAAQDFSSAATTPDQLALQEFREAGDSPADALLSANAAALPYTPQPDAMPVPEAQPQGSQLIDPLKLPVAEPPIIDPYTGQMSPWSPKGIQDFSFTDQLGRTVTRETLKGKPWAICFVFTNCRGPCPDVTKAMKELQDRTTKYDLRLVTLTVDPDRDTPAILKGYAEAYGADGNRWLFLSGDPLLTYSFINSDFKLGAGKNFGTDSKPGHEYFHSAAVMLVDREGVVRGKYLAVDPISMLALRRDLIGLAKYPTTEEAIAARNEEESESPSSSASPSLPRWVAGLPGVNASLNGLATILLLAGYIAIKFKHVHLHRRLMLTAFSTSIMFLCCYLAYHWGLHHYTQSSGKKFEGPDAIRPIYFFILITHVALAALVPVLAIMTLSRAFRGDFVRHRQIAVFTFPIWLYVSVTGVVIYLMLYVIFPGG